MSPEDYPEDIEIKKTNFKTDQQEEAAETLAEEWPSDLDAIAEKGGHVRMFYSQVLAEFLGPVDAEMTFSEIESEYGGLEQWADGEGSEVEVPDVEDLEPGVADESGEGGTAPDPGDVATGSDGPVDTADGDDAGAAASVAFEDVAADVGETVDGDVDERRREWFAAGFREGVEFALRNPDLFRRE